MQEIKSKIGFIGYGSMGRMIINGFLSSGVLRPENAILSNRTLDKLIQIKNKYPEIEITSDNGFLQAKCDKIFFFVATSAVKEVIENIKGNLSEDSHIIYISAGLTMKNVSSIFPGKISKVIPSITSEVGEGVSLICHNQKVTERDAEVINELFNAISTVKIIDEEDFELGADLTSCTPAFIAQIVRDFAAAGAEKGNFSQEEAEDLVIRTLYGTAKLLYEQRISFDELISRVATKGGITEQGVKVLEKELPATFDELLKTTSSRYEEIEEKIDQQYLNK